MTTLELLGRLRTRGIELRADGDKLVVNAPKGALTAELGDELRRRKPEVLEFLRVGAAAASGKAAARIPTANLTQREHGVLEAPMSFGQGRLFYIDQVEPGLASYNVPVAFWLSKPLDVTALRAALDDVAMRHAVLRTSLRFGVDGPVQRIAPTASIEMTMVDLATVADLAERERRLRETLTEQACRAFDLVEGPLVRTALIRLADDAHVLLVTTHHVVTDGWSQHILERDLLAYYEARRQGRTCALAAPDIQFADYAAWQVGGSEDPERVQRVAYWRDQLKLPLPILALPTARPRGALAPTAGDIVPVELPGELVEQLTAIGRRDGATLFMVFLASYAVLLHRVTGQDEIIIGTPIANRNHSQTLELIGFFTNTLALRIDLSGAPTFRELLGRVRNICVGAYANQDVPFDEVVEKLGVARDLSRAPVFQTLFGFDDARPQLTDRKSVV